MQEKGKRLIINGLKSKRTGCGTACLVGMEEFQLPHPITCRRRGDGQPVVMEEFQLPHPIYTPPPSPRCRVVMEEFQLPLAMHKYALWDVYLFGFSLSPFDKMKVPI